MAARKDKTMVHILDTLTRLENKFDNMRIANATDSSSSSDFVTGTRYSPSQSSGKRNERETASGHDIPTAVRRSYQHLTVPHKVILWPSIYLYLVNSGMQAATDLQHILQEGTSWLVKREMTKHPDPLAADCRLLSYRIGAADEGYSTRTAFPSLTIQLIHEYTDAYFNTFNVLYPILNHDAFLDDTVSRLMRDGYADGDPGAVLALMVFALGQCAKEGVFGDPTVIVNGVPSGYRGGTIERPPGIEIFNEARRRLGFVVTLCSLENVQILLLQATYLEATGRHLDFWRSTVAASMACQVLVRCHPLDWATQEGDMIKRAYWACVLSEDLYHLDLDLPQTGIHTLEDEVPLPYFQEAQDQLSGERGVDERSYFQYHFLAMIALRRLIGRIHNVIHESSSTHPESSDDYGGPPVPVITEMARQLDAWRSLLPRPLQWHDYNMLDFPISNPQARRPSEPLFSPHQGSVPINHKFNLDIVTAQLRTRFYYARFMMFRPFVYKALHFPELMTAEDANYCALAIQSACLWPVSMAPPKNKKRLVPHHFTWTQNFMGILLILRMTKEEGVLKQICEGRVDEGSMEMTVQLMLEWFRDVRQVDGIAEWSWRILEGLFERR
ncbi:hypothetical protein B0A48_18484 [Cryoendolithus antarcticus]|uniref:Xylanolytic transcriptional activator regulatory domain-containing protein n=1 Tax=Cryoendolithus antarcticus TaxID=1507870 RepID=A0A1V8S8V6_9PEZI|nr:hypothetical protein B0A48_18484 [Cryoendolithus antarcticus]